MKKRENILRCIISNKIINNHKEVVLKEYAGVYVEKQGENQNEEQII